MDKEQALAELARLCEAMDRTLDRLRPHQLREWLDALMALSPQRARAAITQIILTWTWTSFPPVGALRRADQETSMQGVPNAGAYAPKAPPTPEDSERIRRSVEQQEEWISMAEDEYFAQVLQMQSEGRLQLRGG